MNTPRLKDGKKSLVHELYALGEIPKDVIVRLCSHLVYLMAIGRRDISGDDFGDAFAFAVNGVHFKTPVGIADVGVEKQAWSAKTVKAANPWGMNRVRLISGRNSPDYSYGIEDPHLDLQKTGNAVLGIWNERINIAYSNFSNVRTVVLVRSNDLSKFLLYEEDTRQIIKANYTWQLNANHNFVGVDSNGEIGFTWQPHGAQFTIHSQVPTNAIKFQLRKPAMLSETAFLLNLKYGEDWVHILNS